MLCDCMTVGGMCSNIDFCIFFGQSGWVSRVCYFVLIKRFSLYEMCILM